MYLHNILQYVNYTCTYLDPGGCPVLYRYVFMSHLHCIFTLVTVPWNY